jgi:hypothetical protein
MGLSGASENDACLVFGRRFGQIVPSYQALGIHHGVYIKLAILNIKLFYKERLAFARPAGRLGSEATEAAIARKTSGARMPTALTPCLAQGCGQEKAQPFGLTTYRWGSASWRKDREVMNR